MVGFSLYPIPSLDPLGGIPLHRTLLVSLILLSMATSCWGATFITTTAIDARLAGRDVLLAVNDRSTKEMDTSALKSSLCQQGGRGDLPGAGLLPPRDPAGTSGNPMRPVSR